MSGVPDGASGPLVLGAGGRLGRAWRAIHAAGLWPGAGAPLWQMRRAAGNGPGDAVHWDLLADNAPPDPRIDRAAGLIVLAGATAGNDEALALNTRLAEVALRLARERGLGPVLLMSSAAVYGQSPAPAREEDTPRPLNAYGAAKAAMERAVAGGPGGTCLRLANVAGCDMLFGAAARGPVRLDRFPDGAAPRRAYVGPWTLARTLLRLIELGKGGVALPDVLNLAAPGTVGMDALLSAAGCRWDWTPAPATALPALALDTARLEALAPIPPEAGTAEALVAEARRAGWLPAATSLAQG
ncbi:MAG: NAD-dependent epimerase/dehydratase family protein [Rubellimicrobium sp.]|nr:NAD-dependent epimerase/dehydratase family protein [Rubellimicrobium sp.]